MSTEISLKQLEQFVQKAKDMGATAGSDVYVCCYEYLNIITPTTTLSVDSSGISDASNTQLISWE